MAYFNTEFGKLFLETDRLELAKERIDKALEYNNKYPFAHLALACYNAKKNKAIEPQHYWNEFSKAIKDADPDAIDMVKNEFRKLSNGLN
jgi:Tfp pilus assembly protein PilF